MAKKTVSILTEGRDVFSHSYSSEVVFDRKADVERTRQRALQAAEKAEQQGLTDKADRLRAEAAYLDEILAATSADPWQSGTSAGNGGGDGTGANDDEGNADKVATQKEIDQSNKAAQKAAEADGDSDSDSGPDSDSNDQNSDSNDDSDSQGNDSGDSTEDNDTGKGKGNNGTDDIANLDNGSGIGGGKGASSNSNSGGSGKGGSGSPSGGTGSSSGNGSSNSSSDGGEIDPFSRGMGDGGVPANQVSPEQEFEAIIKRIKGLTGSARVGAERALRDYYNSIGGTGVLQ